MDNYFTITCSAGIILVDHTTIKQSHAEGDAYFYSLLTEGCIDAGGNTGWIFTFTDEPDRYWVNNSGNWNDPYNWSVFSGGPSGAAPPTSANNVYFDVNSFTEGGCEVVVSASVCNNMSWSGVQYLPTLKFDTDTTTQSLTAYGNITFTPNMYIQYDLPINLSMFINNINDDGVTPCIVIAGETNLINATIPLPPLKVIEDATLTLEDDFVGSTLYVKGNLDAQEHDITVKAIKICPETTLYNIRITSNEYVRIDSNGNIRISILG